MRILVTVRPRARRTSVEPVNEWEFVVRVPDAPEKGKANDAVTRALADHFGVAPSRVRIIMGKTARDKVVEIL